ncbi:MAG: hypothetical protein MZU95_03910 [Desulfomicrobium escambiense]|nr:hypothetical protein [Desulfomicrobium escambiense]
MVDDFIDRKQGASTKITYELPQLEADPRRRPTASSSTRSRSCRSPASWPSYTMGEADILRTRHGQEEPGGDGEAEAQVPRRGAQERASPRRRPEKIFDLMETFAGYGFNKSHSAAYAHDRLPDRLPQGPLPGRVHGCAADQRDMGNTDKVVKLHQRVQDDGHRGPACPTSTRANGNSRSSAIPCVSASRRSRAPAPAAIDVIDPGQVRTVRFRSFEEFPRQGGLNEGEQEGGREPHQGRGLRLASSARVPSLPGAGFGCPAVRR